MSGLDPLAVLAAQAVANAQASMDQAILSLGADVAVLQAQVSVGEVIAAVVLPPQNGTDLLSFLGQTVPAQIPPGIDPGETLLLQVTGFTNQAVIVRNLGTLDPEHPVPTVNVELPVEPLSQDGPQSAVLTTQLAPTTAPPAAPTTPSAAAPAHASQPAVAPPREVFVAASVRPNLAATTRELAAQIEAAVERNEVVDVEARIALNRASLPQTAPGSSSAPPQAARTSVPPAAQLPAPSAQSAPVPPSSGRFPVAPPIVTPAQAQEASEATQSAPPPVAGNARPSMPPTPEAALLTRLRIPITPTTFAAARAINSAAQNVSTSYQRLENVLQRLMPESSGPLRTMLAFAGRMDLRYARSLPEQIATYVADVLDGAEAKLAQLIEAWSELEVPSLTDDGTGLSNAQQPSSPPAAPPPPLPAQAATQPAQQAANVVALTNASAQAAERAAAMDYDVKTAILTMLSSAGSSGATPELATALRAALTATTALQLNVLNAQASDPRAITIPLPAYFHEGGEPVQLRISRDAPNGKNAMDADNFHIAFVLDTKSLGTVAIDLQTVGREVTVDVKTQATPAADRFRTNLGELRSRLEQLHYRVAKIGADVAAAGAAAVKPADPSDSAEPARRGLWDTRA